MEHDLPSAAYLDAIFAAIRAFAQEMDAAKRWMTRAEQTPSRAFRLSFLREARAALERAPARLAAAEGRLAELGPVDTLPAPLDRIHGNLAAMRTDLAAQEERFVAAASQIEPLGQA